MKLKKNNFNYTKRLKKKQQLKEWETKLKYKMNFTFD